MTDDMCNTDNACLTGQGRDPHPRAGGTPGVEAAAGTLCFSEINRTYSDFDVNSKGPRFENLAILPQVLRYSCFHHKFD